MYYQVRACVRCRRKKIRCNSTRPSCHQCAKASVSEDCIYGEHSRTHDVQLLEDRIQQLTARIASLENDVSGPVVLHDPYALFHAKQSGVGARSSNRQDIPHDAARALFQLFSRVAAQAGFFLPPGRLLQSTSVPHAASLPIHISALRNAAYLVGAYVSDDEHLQRLQDQLLENTLEDLSAALIDLDRPIMADVVQTEVLLATYLISCNRGVEGVYHLDGASALLLAGCLQESGAQRAGQSQFISDPRRTQGADDVVEAELARATVAVAAMDSFWSSVLRRAPRLTESTSHVPIHPPPTLDWAGTHPDMNHYNTPILLPDRLLQLHAQAASLYSSATQLSAQFTSSPRTYRMMSSELVGRIATFQQKLLHLDIVGRGQDTDSRLLLAHMLVYCALVQLHQPLDHQGTVGIAMNSQTFAAAYNAANVLSHYNTGALTFVDPSMGPMLLSVGGVLINGLRFLRTGVPPPGTSVPFDAGEQSIQAALVRIHSIMTAWSERSDYMKTQLTALLEMLQAPV